MSIDHRTPERPPFRAACSSTGTLRTSLGYGAGVILPVAITWAVAVYDAPASIFEHAIVLLVVGLGVQFGLGPSIAAVVVAIAFDNLMLREPIGQPTITAFRDAIDLALFAGVALIISSLVRRANDARREAQESAARERVARESRDRLIATVAHDLATPLAMLSATVSAARMLGPNLETEWPRLIRRLDTACQRAVSLVRSLGETQALESREFELETAVHDWRLVIMPVVDMMNTLSDRHAVVFDAPPNPVHVRIDVERMRRVLENLVGNAIKYSPAGGRVEVSLTADATTAMLRVRDYGIGISAAARPRIFEHSYRAPETEGIPGLGLGLTIAAQVTARHGGDIEVASPSGEGTLITVKIPLASAEPVSSYAPVAGSVHS